MEKEELNEVYDQKDDLEDEFKSVFTIARKEYDSLVEYLSEKVFPGRVEFEHNYKNTEFELKQGLKDLDMILQYSLLELEYKNGKVRDEIVEGIEGVCRHGSLMREFRINDEYFNWPDFTELNSKEIRAKLEALKVFILKVSKDFANFLVFYQPEEDVHFRKIIQQKMNNIINVIWYQNPNLIGHEYRSACLTNAVFKQLVHY